MPFVQEIILSASSFAYPKMIQSVYGDTDRILRMSFSDYTIPGGATAVLNIHRPDATFYSIACTIGTNYAECAQDQILTRLGVVSCSLEFTASGKVLSSFPFFVEVIDNNKGADPSPQSGISIYEIYNDLVTLLQKFPITSADLADGAVTTNKIGAGAVTTPKIADAAVTTPKLDDAVIDLMLVTDEVSDEAIVSIPDGAKNIPVKDLVCGIEPMQDLHGYANPWPAGGGKNKFYMPNATGSQSGVTYVYDSATNTLTKSGTSSDSGGKNLGSFTVASGTYTFSAKFADANDPTSIYIRDKSTNTNVGYISKDSQTANVTLDGEYYFRVSSAPGSVSGSISEFQLELGNSKTDYAPYSNICPISGWTGMQVTRTGKNQFDKTANDVAKGYKSNYYLNSSGGEVSFNGLAISEYIPAKPAMAYTLSGISGASPALCYYNINKEYISGVAYAGNSSISFTTPNDCAYLRFTVVLSSVDSMQLELGSTATAYEAYSGTVYPITWQTEAGTVYGGYVTVKHDGSAVLTVDKVVINKTWEEGYSATDLGECIRKAFSGISDAVTGANKSLCNCAGYEYAFNSDHPHYWINTATQFYVVLPEGTANDFPIQMVYSISAPIEIPLDSATITTLLGTNNLWTDTGRVELLDYYCDTKLYIARMIGNGNRSLSMAPPVLSRDSSVEENAEEGTEEPTELRKQENKEEER